MNNVLIEDDGLVKRTTRCLRLKYLEEVNGRRHGSRGSRRVSQPLGGIYD